MNSILIIGSSNRVSKELTQLYAEKGHNLIIATRDISQLHSYKDLRERYNIDVDLVQLDLTDFSNHKSICDSFLSKIIGVITTTGFYPNPKDVHNNKKDFIKCIEVNFTGVCSILNIIADKFERQKKGFIIGISSVSGERGRKKNYIYGSSKAAYTTYLSGLRNRLYKSGVHVMTVIPGFIKEDSEKVTFSCSPNYLARQIYTSCLKRKNVIYVKWYWRYIMFVINLIPEYIFKKVDI